MKVVQRQGWRAEASFRVVAAAKAAAAVVAAEVAKADSMAVAKPAVEAVSVEGLVVLVVALAAAWVV